MVVSRASEALNNLNYTQNSSDQAKNHVKSRKTNVGRPRVILGVQELIWKVFGECLKTFMKNFKFACIFGYFVVVFWAWEAKSTLLIP